MKGHRIWPLSVIVGALALAGMFYFPDVVLAPPYGLHYIRQTDALAFVQYYTHYSLDLFAPGVLDLRNAPIDGRSAGEFPLLYWLTGIAQRCFGPAPSLLRWLNLALVMTGHVFLIHSFARILNDKLLAAGTGLLIFSSGVVTYYACNYLPDAAAYGLVLIGWSRSLPHLFNATTKVPLSTVITFFLAALIKAPALMHLVVVGSLQIEAMLRNSFATVDDRMRYRSSQVGLAILIVVAWHAHVNFFNHAHGSAYFLTWVEPLWQTGADEIMFTADLIWNFWWSKYLHPSVWHALLIMSIALLVGRKRIPDPVGRAVLLLILACGGFIVLFFRKFADHDYYFLTLMPLVMAIVILAQWLFAKALSGPWPSRIHLVLTWVLAISAANLAHNEVQRRQERPLDAYSRTGALTSGLADSLRVNGLDREARVVVLGDSTTNGALSVVGRLGWTYPGYPVPTPPPTTLEGHAGASHVLLLTEGELVPPYEGLQLHDKGDGWGLWRITGRAP